jgi:ribosomal protein S18 acetylase RimI-like enzyme
MSMDIVIPATTSEHYREFAVMVREYVEWCRERYAADSWIVDATFGHQLLEQELQELSSSYGPPGGRAFLARSGDGVVGCIAYREMSDAICEMKRLFVRKGGQGRGIGRRLCMTLIDAARSDGYALMRLDTANLLTEAIALYRSVGFRDCAAYNHYADDLMPNFVFMELPLSPIQPVQM